MSRFRVKRLCLATLSFEVTEVDARTQFCKGSGRDLALDLSVIGARVSVPWIQQSIIPLRLVAEQEKALGITVQSADGVNVRWKPKLRQGAVRGVLLSELGEHAKGLIEGKDHGQKEGRLSRACL
jgi:hypothetical protein